MLGEEFLPPYTPVERSRELRHSSRALCKRVRRTCSQSKQLLDESALLLINSQYALLTTVLTCIPHFLHRV